jgi:hypothetical protein
MRVQVTEPGQKPYFCTMPVESIGFLIQNGCLVVPVDRNTGEYEKYREIVGGFQRDSAPSYDSLRNERLHHYEKR